jgi:hypothetical protein
VNPVSEEVQLEGIELTASLGEYACIFCMTTFPIPPYPQLHIHNFLNDLSDSDHYHGVWDVCVCVCGGGSGKGSYHLIMLFVIPLNSYHGQKALNHH